MGLPPVYGSYDEYFRLTLERVEASGLGARKLP